MPLQNRVRPDGAIEADPARGMFTGNRGIIHDPDTKTLLKKRWTNRAWIVCVTQFKERRRPAMGKGAWTELFFLDEVTALAAGHRPCFECRREAAKAFCAAVASESGAARIPAPQIDRRLHAERRASCKTAPQRVNPIDLPGLPNGTTVDAGGRFFVLKDKQALPWTHSGYGSPAGFGELERLGATLVTPLTALHALKSGYRPVWHGTASN